MTTARPIYLDINGAAVFGLVHNATKERPLGIVVCPPWGWDEVASYRVRRRWADHLAGRGATVLRFDLPATGDSAGDPSDGDRFGSWVRSIAGAASWLRGQPNIDRVVALGLGLGGSLALEAIADGAPIDDVVLWAVHSSGRRFVRGLRAFAGTQSDRFSLDHDEPAVLPHGWLEVNGFVLHGDTATSLAGMNACSLSTGTLQRALLLDQDGIAVDGDLVAYLTGCGVDTTSGDGGGWADMTSHPERSVMPTAVVDRVDQWLADAPAIGMHLTVDPVQVRERAHIVVGGVTVAETALCIPTPDATLFAVAAEPVGAAPASDACAIFLNAGAVRRIGPNRLWVTVARRWAAAGLPSLRVDTAEIGDGSGDSTHPDGIPALYDEDRLTQVVVAVDHAAERWPGRKIVVVGLCAGGYWSLRVAQRDRRVDEAILINVGAIVWQADTLDLQRARKLAKVLDPIWIRRLLRGQIRLTTIADALRSAAVLLRRAPARVLARRAVVSSEARATEEAFDLLASGGARVVLAFSGDEVAEHGLARVGVLAQLSRWPNVEHRVLPGRDHTVRPMAAQSATLDLLDEVVARHAI